MKGTETFKKVIDKYLRQRAAQDPLFAKTLMKEGKNLDDCVTYILNTVQQSGNNGFDDSEIYNMAVHYYDEDDIKVGDPITGVQIVSNHHVELTDEEKAEARQKAKDKLIREEEERLRKKGQGNKPKPDPKDTTPGEQLSLF